MSAESMGDQQQQPPQQVPGGASQAHILSQTNCIAIPRSCRHPLSTTSGEDAFFWRALSLPEVARDTDDENDNAPCPAQELPLQPPQRISGIRVSGDPDLLKRPIDDGFALITVPPVAKGQAEVTFELPPSRLVRRLGHKDETVENKMKRFLRPGDTYTIKAATLGVKWWAFGSLKGDDGLLKKKIARWTFPDDLPLIRKLGDDETDDVAHRLRDLVDLYNVNSLSSRNAVEGEQRPVVREMRAEDWVFGESEVGLNIVPGPAGKEASFMIVK